jgi:hypothetical protein
MAVGSTSWRRLLLAASVVALTALALQQPPSPAEGQGRQCDLNSECMDPLVCRWGNCRQQCAEDRDCPAGLDLVCRKVRRSGKEYGACVADGPRGTPCVNAGDCTSRRCSDGTCR